MAWVRFVQPPAGEIWVYSCLNPQCASAMWVHGARALFLRVARVPSRSCSPGGSVSVSMENLLQPPLIHHSQIACSSSVGPSVLIQRHMSQRTCSNSTHFSHSYATESSPSNRMVQSNDKLMPNSCLGQNLLVNPHGIAVSGNSCLSHA